MIDFLKNNAWFLSLGAIMISFISVVFVIIDKVKIWKENTKNSILKRDKAILSPILDIKVEDFYSISVKNNDTIFSPYYSRLFHLFQKIDTSSLSNKTLANDIELIKIKKVDDLFEVIKVPNGIDFSIQFSKSVIEIISASKKHLANIL